MKVNSTFARIKKIQEILDEKEYLKQEEAKQPSWRRFVHFWVLVVNSFQKNRGPVRAASLAYTTLLALVPVLALVVSISTGLLQNDEGKTINMLLDRFLLTVAPQLNLMEADEEEVSIGRADAVQRIRGFIDRVNSGTLGVTAGVALFVIAMLLLSTVEATFNDIWGVTHGRSWAARIVQYWAAITLGPIFIATAVALTTGAQIQSDKAAGRPHPLMNSEDRTIRTLARSIVLPANGVSVLVSDPDASEPFRATISNPPMALPEKSGFRAKLDRASQWLLAAPVIGWLILKLLPFVVLTILMTLIYRLMPATKVLWSAALVGGAVGGTLLQLNNLFSVIYVSRVLTYSKIYGSLGAVPIFLVGLYFSWIIILFGAQVAYAFQNRTAYVQEKQAETINQRGREFVALRIMTLVGQCFHTGVTPPSRLVMSNLLGVPSQLACQVLAYLVQAKLLVEVIGDETRYAPGRPLEKISVEDILAALRVGQGTDLATTEDSARAVVREEYERITLAEMQTAGAVTLNDLVHRAEKVAPLKEIKSEAAPA